MLWYSYEIANDTSLIVCFERRKLNQHPHSRLTERYLSAYLTPTGERGGSKRQVHQHYFFVQNGACARPIQGTFLTSKISPPLKRSRMFDRKPGTKMCAHGRASGRGKAKRQNSMMKLKNENSNPCVSDGHYLLCELARRVPLLCSSSSFARIGLKEHRNDQDCLARRLISRKRMLR